ncbi:MAG TPA: PAS domain S-box protein [Alphaproteobacteria bacterium]|nr:PAS domain S-box protein [Alphaproteobacteria bacterium]
MAKDGEYRSEVGDMALSEIAARTDHPPAEADNFRATFEHAAIGIAHVSVDGTWLRVNRRLCDMLGYGRDELLAMTFQDLTHPEDLHADLELFNAVLAGQRDTYSMEKRYFRRDGSVVPVNLTVAVVRLSDGAPSYFISMVDDITARKEMEESLRRSQKMEVIGQLTSSIAHDFGNFLNVVKGNLQLLQLAQLDGKNSEYVSSALTGAELAEKLIRQLLSFSRHQEPELEALDIDVLIKGVGALLRRAVHNRIALNFSLQAADFSLICDRVQLETALFNLILNARDAIGDNDGRITVTTRTVQRNGNDYVRLSVRDSGQGMAPEVLARAMEPFFTTKAVGEGTGLGLSQVARCVAEMKGFVEIDTKPVAGTDVQLFLPTRQILSL